MRRVGTVQASGPANRKEGTSAESSKEVFYNTGINGRIVTKTRYDQK